MSILTEVIFVNAVKDSLILKNSSLVSRISIDPTEQIILYFIVLRACTRHLNNKPSKSTALILMNAKTMSMIVLIH